jgi:pimeloyl-ACP methyl ester carboxylesterase
MPETRVVETRSAKLEVDFYSESGSLVCLLPGLGGGIRRFGDLGTHLASAGWRPVAINPRGAGLSQGELEGLTLHDLAGDVAGVVESLGGGPAALIGHAFGNRLARCTAADRPDLISRVVLVCAGGKIPAEPDAARAMVRVVDASLSEEERIEAARVSLFAEGNEVPADFVRDNRSADAAAAQLKAIDRTDTADWWSGGTAPMLVIQGEQDRIAPVANGHLLREEFPDRVTVIDLPRAGHAVLNEKPAEVGEAISAFLRKHHG